MLRYGTSSWSETSWVGPFYPPGTKPGDFLTHYATQFSTVEADNTYYRVPSRELVRGWEERTPKDFVLSAKFPRTVVHGGQGEKPDAARLFDPRDTAAFLDAMSILGPKCGPLVLQFPYFNQGAGVRLRQPSMIRRKLLDRVYGPGAWVVRRVRNCYRLSTR